jgi:hypothetical protein
MTSGNSPKRLILSGRKFETKPTLNEKGNRGFTEVPTKRGANSVARSRESLDALNVRPTDVYVPNKNAADKSAASQLRFQKYLAAKRPAAIVKTAGSPKLTDNALGSEHLLEPNEDKRTLEAARLTRKESLISDVPVASTKGMKISSVESGIYLDRPLTLREFAFHISRSRKTILRQISSGHIDFGAKVCGHYIFKKEDIDAYLEDNSVQNLRRKKNEQR